jgi:hypothetical protein
MAAGCLLLISGIVFYIVRDVRILRRGPPEATTANDNRTDGTKD